MSNSDDESRLLVSCDQCGSVYAAQEIDEGSIQPIGSRRGCSSCGGTQFTPVSITDGDSGCAAGDDD